MLGILTFAVKNVLVLQNLTNDMGVHIFEMGVEH